MNNVISFTPAQIFGFVLAICGAIASISTAAGVIAKAIEKSKAPEIEQNKRLDAHDRRLKDHDEVIKQFKQYFTNDDNRFKAIEKSNKITQSALLALLKHSINGEDIKSLKEAERSLEEYLIEK
jgi:hypothetical protein